MAKLHIGPKHLINNKQPVLITEKPAEIVSITKEVIVKEFYDVIKEVPVYIYVDKPVERIKEVEKIVYQDVIKHIKTEVPVESIKYVYIDKPIEIIKEIEKFVEKQVKVVPRWIYGILSVQTLIIVYLLMK